MVDLKLEQNEGILLQTTDVGRYDGCNELEVYELCLTNKHLISVYEKSNGFFEKPETVVDKIPLTSICVINGIVQVEQVDDDDYGKALQIIYNNGKRELIELNVSPKKEYPKWKAAISDAVLKCGINISMAAPNSNATHSYNNANVSASTPSSGELRFCSYCGTKLDQGARFCKGCGKALGQAAQPTAATNVANEVPTETFSHEPITERKTVYEGNLHKCPNCGELLDSFRSHCPSCGYEIRGARSSSSVRELAQKLENIEAQKMPHIEEKKSVMKMLVGKDLKEESEVEEAQERFDEHKRQQKANLIINFSVPNTKEDILEFMILASSNIDVKKGLDDEVSKAWLQKLEQVYEKAKLLMDNSADFAQIKTIYDTKKNQIKAKRRKALFGTIGGIAGWFFLLGLLWNPAATIGIAIGVIVLIIIGFVLFKKR